METELELLTLREVAKLLRTSPLTVYRMIWKKKIPAKKIGGQWRFIKSEIKDYIKFA